MKLKSANRIKGFLLAGTACLVLAACSSPQTESVPPRPVRAVQVPAGGQITSQRFAARIEARHDTALAFEVGGRISARLVDVGDTVATGAVLARLDENDLRLRERDLASRLAASEAERADAATALRRATDLRPKGFVSEAELDRARFRDQATSAQAQALSAQLALARRELGYATLIAPAAGVITARTVEAGQVVSAGQPAFTLAQTGQIEAVFDLPESQRAALPDTVQVTLWTQPQPPLTARVREVAPQAADASRTVRVRATLPVTDNPPALGSSASVTFDTTAPLLAIPASAVVKRDDGSAAVWVIDADHAARLKPITLGPLQGDQTSIAAGLAPGEWVITAGVHDLRDGQPITLP